MVSWKPRPWGLLPRNHRLNVPQDEEKWKWHVCMIHISLRYWIILFSKLDENTDVMLLCFPWPSRGSNCTHPPLHGVLDVLQPKGLALGVTPLVGGIFERSNSLALPVIPTESCWSTISSCFFHVSQLHERFSIEYSINPPTSNPSTNLLHFWPMRACIEKTKKDNSLSLRV